MPSQRCPSIFLICMNPRQLQGRLLTAENENSKVEHFVFENLSKYESDHSGAPYIGHRLCSQKLNRNCHR